MAENDIYGEEASFGGKPVEMKPEGEPKKTEGYPLRVYFTGGSVDILSPLPKEKFLVDLISEITTNSADPNWSGWFGFRVKPKSKTDKSTKTISVMVRQIVGVEEI